jgi:hypothetical protein
VFKIHPIWCPIAQKSMLGRMGAYFVIKSRFQIPHIGQSSKFPDIVWPYPGYCPTFVHCFGHSLISRCPIDPILFSLCS